MNHFFAGIDPTDSHRTGEWILSAEHRFDAIVLAEISTRHDKRRGTSAQCDCR